MPPWPKAIARLDKTFCWSFLGCLVGIISFVLAVYFAAYYERKPKLAFELLSDTSIVDLKEDSKALDILYAGNSIKATGMALRVLTIRVVNEGNAPLRKEDYVAESPLGLVISEGTLIETPSIERATTDYLTANVKPCLTGDKRVDFPPVLLNVNDSFTVKLLVLQRERSGDDIRVTPSGEVVGASSRDIPVRRLLESQPGPQVSFWAQVFSGSLLVHIARLGVFVALSVLLLKILELMLDIVQDKATRREIEERRAIVDAYKKESTYRACDIADHMFELFVRDPYELRNRVFPVLVKKRIGQQKLADLDKRTCDLVGKVAGAGARTTYRLNDEAAQIYGHFAAYLSTRSHYGFARRVVQTMATKHGPVTSVTPRDEREHDTGSGQQQCQAVLTDVSDTSADVPDMPEVDEHA